MEPAFRLVHDPFTLLFLLLHLSPFFFSFSYFLLDPCPSFQFQRHLFCSMFVFVFAVAFRAICFLLGLLIVCLISQPLASCKRADSMQNCLWS